MISWTITAPPTVASARSELTSAYANSFEGGDKNSPFDYDELLASGSIQYAMTGRSEALRNGVFSLSASGHGAQGLTQAGDAIGTGGAQITMSTDLGGYFVLINSWDGQESFYDQDTSGARTSVSTTIPLQTSSTAETYVLSVIQTSSSSTLLTGTTTENEAGQTVASTSSTTKSFTTNVYDSTLHSTTMRCAATTTQSVAKWNGNTGFRATLTVVELDPNEVLLVATTTGVGAETASFLSLVTDTRTTITPSWEFHQGITWNADVASSTETTVLSTDTYSCTSFKTETITPLYATKIPLTTTEQKQIITTATSSTEHQGSTPLPNAPKTQFVQWLTTTIEASIGTLTFPQTINTSFDDTTTFTNAINIAPSFSTIVTGIDPIFGDEDYGVISVSSGSTSWQSALEYDIASPLMVALVGNNQPWRTAASFFQARSPMSNLSTAARDVMADNITYSPGNQARAAQTAVVQFPETWSYTSGLSSITNSANPNGLSQTIKTGTLQTTTKSGAWVLSNNPVIQQSTEYLINPIVTAPTDTASVFVPFGWYFTSDNSGASGTVFVDNVQTIASNPNRVASSAMPVFSVGDGQWFVVSQRNYIPTSL